MTNFAKKLQIVDHPWTGSYLPLDMKPWEHLDAQTPPDMVMVYLLVAIGLLALVFYDRIINGFFGAVLIYKNEVRMKEVMRDAYCCANIRILFYFLIPFLPLVLTGADIGGRGYWGTLLVVVILFVFRLVVIRLISMLSANREEMKVLTILNRAIFAIIIALFLIILVLVQNVPFVTVEVAKVLLGIVAGVGLIFFFHREKVIFLRSGFSHFLWILYLCALEILPICVAITALVP